MDGCMEWQLVWLRLLKCKCLQIEENQLQLKTLAYYYQPKVSKEAPRDVRDAYVFF